MATPARPAAPGPGPTEPVAATSADIERLVTGLPVNWSLAAATGTRLVPPGPAVSAEQAAIEVARLRAGARDGEEHVRSLTGLGDGLPVPEADVVDRPDWIRSAVAGIAELTGGVRLPAREVSGAAGVVGSALAGVTSTAAGVQMGALLGFLGSRVLGQYDPFTGGPSDQGERSSGEHAGRGSESTAGRLLLVAPNVTAARQALDVDGDDFALWVCLHEATHRLQFTAVPWLRDHFREEVGTLASGIDGGASGAVERLPDILRALREGSDRGDGGRRRPDAFELMELLQGPEQRAILDRLIALTTLLEGHAEHVMDEVGPAVVPSVATIRERFTARRRGGSLIDRILRTVLGMEAKVRQYEQGRVFVDTVVREIGMDGFNRIWTSPDTLPRRKEITEPAAWIARVHG